jgi:hypothetical protein
MRTKHLILDFRFGILDFAERDSQSTRVRRNISLIVALWPGSKKFNGGKDKDNWMPEGLA